MREGKRVEFVPYPTTLSSKRTKKFREEKKRMVENGGYF